MGIDRLKEIWPEWKVCGVLGTGAFGKVYKVVDEEAGFPIYSAVKVLSIPSSEAELDALRSEGMSVDESKYYFKEIVDSFTNEIRLMHTLKGAPNIVSVEAFKIIEKTNSVGWDIFIRMELLTSFKEYLESNTPNEDDVIKMGIDISTALEICQKKNIIHRDIKPANIFFDEFGSFKLGDFGIAKELEKTTGAASSKGTFSFMAPEVARGQRYNNTVDIYSLGLVMYSLLNNNRPPFVDANKSLVSYGERKEANDKRLSGVELTPPCNASPELADIILMACAYDPAKRFKSATAFKNALLGYKNKTTIPVNQNSNQATNADVQKVSLKQEERSFFNFDVEKTFYERENSAQKVLQNPENRSLFEYDVKNASDTTITVAHKVPQKAQESIASKHIPLKEEALFFPEKTEKTFCFAAILFLIYPFVDFICKTIANYYLRRYIVFGTGSESVSDVYKYVWNSYYSSFNGIITLVTFAVLIVLGVTLLKKHTGFLLTGILCFLVTIDIIKMLYFCIRNVILEFEGGSPNFDWGMILALSFVMILYAIKGSAIELLAFLSVFIALKKPRRGFMKICFVSCAIFTSEIILYITISIFSLIKGSVFSYNNVISYIPMYILSIAYILFAIWLYRVSGTYGIVKKKNIKNELPL